MPNTSSTPKGVRVLLPRNKNNVDGDGRNNTTAAAAASNRYIHSY